MPLKFRLKDLCETILYQAECPVCEYDHEVESIEFKTSSYVTLEGVAVVAECEYCHKLFIPPQENRVFKISELWRAIDEDVRWGHQKLWLGIDEVQANIKLWEMN